MPPKVAVLSRLAGPSWAVTVVAVCSPIGQSIATPNTRGYSLVGWNPSDDADDERNAIRRSRMACAGLLASCASAAPEPTPRSNVATTSSRGARTGRLGRLAARRVAEGDHDERAVSIDGPDAASVGRHVVAEPADARRAGVDRALDRRPLVGGRGAERPVARGRLDHEEQARAVALEPLERRQGGVDRSLDERVGVRRRAPVQALRG